MAEFRYIQGTTHINLDHVKKFEEQWNRETKSTTLLIEFIDGTTMRANGRSSYIETGPVVPAQPGFELIMFWFHTETPPSEDGVLAGEYRTPIIAWKIDGATAMPVSVDGEDDITNGERAILQPNGNVCAQGDRWFEDMGKWREHVAREWAAWVADKVKRPEQSR